MTSTVRDVGIGWPFLVARGRYTDYRTVLAPDFLVQANLYGLLSDAVTTGGKADGAMRTVVIDGPNGELTVIYRTERLAAGVRASDEEWPTDEHGRSLQIVCGVVMRGSIRGEVAERDLDTARGEAMASFRRFLADERGFTVDHATAFELQQGIVPPRGASTASGVPGSPPPAEPRSRTPIWIGGGFVAVVAAALLAVVAATDQRGAGELLTVTVQRQGDIGSCSEPMVLRAAIKADAAASVRYHWESPLGKTVATPRTLKLGANGTEQVRADIDHSHPPTNGRIETVAYALVIDAPKRSTHRGTYRVRC